MFQRLFKGVGGGEVGGGVRDGWGGSGPYGSYSMYCDLVRASSRHSITFTFHRRYLSRVGRFVWLRVLVLDLG